MHSLLLAGSKLYKLIIALTNSTFNNDNFHLVTESQGKGFKFRVKEALINPGAKTFKPSVSLVFTRTAPFVLPTTLGRHSVR